MLYELFKKGVTQFLWLIYRQAAILQAILIDFGKAHAQQWMIFGW